MQGSGRQVQRLLAHTLGVPQIMSECSLGLIISEVKGCGLLNAGAVITLGVPQMMSECSVGSITSEAKGTGLLSAGFRVFWVQSLPWACRR